MVATKTQGVIRMGGKGGRPRGNAEAHTKHVRVADDLAEMIGWIVQVAGGTTATFLDPIIRAEVEARYKVIQAKVEEVKKRQAETTKILEQAKAELEVPKKKRP